MLETRALDEFSILTLTREDPVNDSIESLFPHIREA